MAATKSIMCFGDSLTWGWIPVVEGTPTRRYEYSKRWTGVMAAQLGDSFQVIEEGLNARTTSADDPNDPRLNGSAYLPTALASHLPLDLVIVLLGTNDTKPYYHRTPFDIAMGMAKLVGQIAGGRGGVGASYPALKALVVAPPALAEMPHPFFRATFGGAHHKLAELGQHYCDMADFMNAEFFDAGSVISAVGCDGIHFTEQNNKDLGKALAAKVLEILK